MSDQSQSASKDEGPVLDQILAAFLDAADAQPELEGVAARLRQTLLVEKQRSESSLRKAIFDEDSA